MINLGRRGTSVLIALGGVLAFGGGVGIAALTAQRPVAPTALIAAPPAGSPALGSLATRTPTAPSTRSTPSAAPTTSAAPRSAATPSRTPSATPRAGIASGSGVAAQVVTLTNKARAGAGCAALRVDPRITRAAQAHSDDMSRRDYFEHDSLDGRSFADRIRAAGYASPGAENIAFGQRSAAEVMQAWLTSPGHRRNILDCELVTIGVGYTADGSYWTQDFGR